MTWIRAAIAVLLAYLLMWSSYALTMVPAGTLVSPDRLRDPETGIMTNWFIFMVQFPVALFTAVIGGGAVAFLAGVKGRNHAIKGLVWFVIIIGLIGGLVNLGNGLVEEIESVSQSESGSMVVEPGSTEVAKDPLARAPEQPVWNIFLLPFVGGLGVLLGGRFVVRMTESLSPTPGSSIPPTPPSPDAPNA